MKRIVLTLLAVILSVAAAFPATAKLVVVYPTESGRNYSDAFPLEVLKLALEKSGRDYVLSPSDRAMSENRSRHILEKGSGEVTIAWYGTSAEFESRLLPIRIPIARGLLGHRLFLIREGSQPTFSAVQSVRDLIPLVGVQGIGWSDVEILRGAGLDILTGEYENLFGLINIGRADYFSRGVNEAFAELQQYHVTHAHLAVEQELVLIYPFAKLFFVSKENKELHDAIYEGLVTAYQDGSYLELFNSHPAIKSMLEMANLDRRRRLFIDNPLMSPETRSIPRQYWFSAPTS